MTVGKLIEALQKFDPNMPCVRYHDEFGGCGDIDLVEEIEIELNGYEGTLGGPHKSNLYDWDNGQRTKAVHINI